MNAILLAIVAMGGLFVVWRLLPRIIEATRQGPWLGAYRAAVHRGMSPPDAIVAALQPLRYRQPWQQLSDDQVATIGAVLGEFREPELFTEILATVERTGDLDHVVDAGRLRRFVAFANSRANG